VIRAWYPTHPGGLVHSTHIKPSSVATPSGKLLPLFIRADTPSGAWAITNTKTSVDESEYINAAEFSPICYQFSLVTYSVGWTNVGEKHCGTPLLGERARRSSFFCPAESRIARTQTLTGLLIAN
jgi:hypothetical protein